MKSSRSLARFSMCNGGDVSTEKQVCPSKLQREVRRVQTPIAVHSVEPRLLPRYSRGLEER